MVSLNHEDTFWGKLQLGVSHSIYLSVTLSLSITFFFLKKIDKAYLQFDLQINVDLRTDNEIKKMILIKKNIFFFLIVPYHFKR